MTRLFIGHTISLLGTSLSYVAFMQKFYELTGSASQWAYLAIIKAAPFLIFGLIFGYFVDLSNRKWILFACEGFRSLIYLALAFCNDLFLFYLLVFLSSVFDAAYEPAYKSLMTSLLEKKVLFSMNSLEESTRSLCAISGIGLSGFILGVAGLHWCFLIDAASYLFSAINLAGISLPRPKFAADTKSNRLFFSEALEGIHTIRRSTQIYDPLIIWTTIVLLISFEAPLFFPLMGEKNWAGAAAAGYIYAGVSLGSLGASVYLARKGHSIVRSISQLAFIILIDAAFLFGIVLTPSYTVALGLSIFLGITETVFRTYSLTKVQEAVPIQKLGRVFSIIYMVHEPLKLLAMYGSAVIMAHYSATAGFKWAIALEVSVALFLVLKFILRGI